MTELRREEFEVSAGSEVPRLNNRKSSTVSISGDVDDGNDVCSEPKVPENSTQEKFKQPPAKRKISACKICGAVYANHFQLNSHMRVHKPKDGLPVPKDLTNSEAVRRPPNPKNYRNLHNGPVVRLWKKRQRIKYPIKVKKKQSQAPVAPDVAEMNGFQDLRKPPDCKLTRIRETNPFECNQCEFRAKTKLSVDLHLKLVHEGVTSHKCMHCWKAFPTLELLSRHLKSVHEETPIAINGNKAIEELPNVKNGESSDRPD